jgi:orotate phosphoribosyltransferase
MNDPDMLKIFRQTGTLESGHFVLTSGLHSPQYFQCARVLQYPRYAERIGKGIAERFRDQGVDAVIAPAIGGILVAHEVARALGNIRGMFAERVNGRMKLRRGFALSPNERILVVEDVITTGGSVVEVLRLAREHGAAPLGVGAVVDRSGGNVDFGLPFFALMTLDAVTYTPEECPLCRQGVPVTKPGSRKLDAEG